MNTITLFNSPNIFLKADRNKFKNQNKAISPKVTNQAEFKLPNFNNYRLIYFNGTIKPAQRLSNSDYKTAGYINEINRARSLYGDREVIELGMGNPDILPPEVARTALKKRVDDLWSHRYNYPKGEWFFRKAVSEWYEKRFGITDIDPNTDVMMTAGASDGVDLILSAYTEKGDKILVPDPGYTVYRDLVARNDLIEVPLNLDPNNDYKADFSRIKKEDLEGVKGLILNYPHNPMGVFATKESFEEAVKFAKENDLFIIHDFDNTEVSHYGNKPVGILEVDGAKDVAFEVHTMSKAHNMPGLRVGFVASNKEFIDNLLSAKLLTNNSVYTAVQSAAAAALLEKDGYIDKVNEEYRHRKTACVDRLKKLGCDAKPSQGTYYLWVKIPEGFTSQEFFKYVLHKAHVALTPGDIFGKNGDDHVRIVMSADVKHINEAFDKIEKAGIRFDVPKNELPEETQEEIRKISNGEIDLTPKAVRDLEVYKKSLISKYNILSERFKEKDSNLQTFLPDLDHTNELPTYLLKSGQKVYLQDTKSTSASFGEVREILPFSKETNYKNLQEYIQDVWVPYAQNQSPKSDILDNYKEGKFYPDATYYTLWANGKLQGLINVEIQDGEFWARSLNTAPWNQGDNPQIKGVGTALVAKAASLCIETGNYKLNLATNKKENIEFYKKLGMKEGEVKEYYGIPYQVLYFDKDSLMKFLQEYQRYLSY